MHFNNRALRDEIRNPVARLLGIDRRGFGAPHYQFSVNDKRIAYAYIRKNACTAFKRLIVSVSEKPPFFDATGNPIEFLGKQHCEESFLRLEECDYRIFVYRDPAERIASLYVNKLVMNKENEDLISNIWSITGKDPWTFSFEDFVMAYVGRPSRKKFDPHVWSQASHLYPIKYTHAIAMADLHAIMQGIIGVRDADRFFCKRINPSEGAVDDRMDEPYRIPATDLHLLWEQKGMRPSAKKLISADLQNRLEELYADDFDLVRKVGRRP